MNSKILLKFEIVAIKQRKDGKFKNCCFDPITTGGSTSQVLLHMMPPVGDDLACSVEISASFSLYRCWITKFAPGGQAAPGPACALR